MKRYAVIVAGGSGKRMGKNIPKQFLLLAQKPVLLHTLEVFYRFDAHITVFLVLPRAYFDEWKLIAEKYRFQYNPILVSGGETRFFSVKNALDVISGTEGKVVVHDGVRPLVSVSLITNIFDALSSKSAIIPVLPLISSIRKKNDDGTLHFADRNRFVSVQTPQGFQLRILKQAYNQSFSDCFTDDASVVEKSGVEIYSIEGEQRNIKITTQTDLSLAEFYLSKTKNI
ncbi:MAG TPA: 2-C-methyl-D-erythritol 4-phosphate cytidylyltransferase [Bacteroidales bacterium]|nr:2-C-methyl-D-erythritol 4-phosphate cytidylyltransferase [Bacteroidales bacterium]